MDIETKVKESRRFVEGYEKMSMSVFGKATYQTIRFCMFEYLAEMKNTPDYKSIEENTSRYLTWQARVFPRNKNIELCRNYSYSRDNDLSWNDCVFYSEKYRKQKEEFGKTPQEWEDEDDPLLEELRTIKNKRRLIKEMFQ